MIIQIWDRLLQFPLHSSRRFLGGFQYYCVVTAASSASSLLTDMACQHFLLERACYIAKFPNGPGGQEQHPHILI